MQFSDFSLPNNALNSGDIQMNAFQHHAYFENDKSTNNYDISILTDTFVIAMNIFSKHYTSVFEIPEGGKIAVPNDATNYGRALILLRDAGLLTLGEYEGSTPSTNDIISAKVELVEVNASMTYQYIDDSEIAAAVVNGNYAASYGVDPSSAIFYETENIEEKYLGDTLGRLKGSAAALVFVKSAEEVSAILRTAHERLIPVTPRGAGTNLVGSTVPEDGGIILDFSLMNRVLELDEQTMTATVEPGILLRDFQKFVEEKGFFYPPDPGEKLSTIGGNISTNAGGMRAVKYGVTRDYVRGLEVVLADGTVMTVGGKNVKDASGLSLKNLFIGLEGTLCVITKCVLKLIPKPEYSKSALIAYPDLDSGINSVLSILRANPTAVEFIARDVAKLGEDFSGGKIFSPGRRLVYSADL